MKDAIESALNSPFRLSGQVVDLTPLNALEWTRASCPECKIKSVLLDYVIWFAAHDRSILTDWRRQPLVASSIRRLNTTLIFVSTSGNALSTRGKRVGMLLLS